MGWNVIVQNGCHLFLQRLPISVTLLLVALLAYQLAAWTLVVLPLPMPELSVARNYTTAFDLTEASSEQVDSFIKRPDAQMIATWHLFGQPATAEILETVVEAPETRLNLRLAGIFYRTDNSALALIAEGSTSERVFRDGDLLADGVSVYQIQTDRVILARAGQLETLSLPRESNVNTANTNKLPASNTPASRTLPSSAAEMISARAVAEQLRDQVAANPAALEQLAFATPHMEQGQFAGLKLRPGRDRRLLARLGLRNGDILTEVNGTLITDPIQGLTMLQNLFTEDQVQIKIVRNGREIPFVFLLTQ